MASYTLQGFTNDASSPDLDATNLNEMDNAIKVGHDFADGASDTPEAGKAMVWPENASGTFTPTLLIGGASTGIVYSLQSGKFTKIGNVIFYRVQIAITSKGVLTGNLQINFTGLPRASNLIGSQPGIILCSSGLTHSGTIVQRFASTTTLVGLAQLTEAGVFSNLTDANLSNSTDFIVQGFYFV